MNVENLESSPLVVRASGEVDYSNVARLNDSLDEAVRESPKGFIIDISQVYYMDSAGIQAILTAYRRVLGAGGKLALVVVHPNMKEILSIINADKFPNFLMVATETEAKAALS